MMVFLDFIKLLYKILFDLGFSEKLTSNQMGLAFMSQMKFAVFFTVLLFTNPCFSQNAENNRPFLTPISTGQETIRNDLYFLLNIDIDTEQKEKLAEKKKEGVGRSGRIRKHGRREVNGLHEKNDGSLFFA